MHDGEAESTAGSEHARCLADRAREVVDVLQGHEGDDEPERGISERECRGVGDVKLELGRGLSRGRDHRR